MTTLPLSMEPLRPYFDRAHELKGAHPFEAHHIRVFAMTLAMKMNHGDAGNFLLQQMDTLEAEKSAVKPPTKPAVMGTKTVEPEPAEPAAGSRCDRAPGQRHRPLSPLLPCACRSAHAGHGEGVGVMGQAS